MITPSQPIGIFDSGIGGLTVTRAIVNRMPEENIIYFGDTAHLPYGDKSPATLRARARYIAGILLEKGCKMILIACNSATSAAADTIRKQAGDRAIVMDVIHPVIAKLAETTHRKIGLIGTRQTVRSGIYPQKLATSAPHVTLVCKATSLLAAAIEEFGSSHVTDSLISEYLSDPAFSDIQSLLLACTHYPVIRDKIADFFNGSVEIIDPTETIAEAAERLLTVNSLRNRTGCGEKHFYVSDLNDSFIIGARLFFGDTINPIHWPAGMKHTPAGVPA